MIYEDEHLLAVNKPAGWNTHAPSPYAGEGIYEWLKHREPRWASLAIVHRLDKETSGVMLFGKTTLANRSLTEQFTARQVQKKYVLLTDRPAPARTILVKSTLVRAGEKYASRPGGEMAETKFAPAAAAIYAWPLTGRTHQIRVHAAESGFPILGDTLYGGAAHARVCLHAAEISFRHPATGAPMVLTAPADFDGDPRLALRRAFIDGEATDAYRIIHGAGDGRPGWYVDRLGEYLLSQSEGPLTDSRQAELTRLAKTLSIRGAYHKILSRQVRSTAKPDASPQLVFGAAAAGPIQMRENGVQFELSFSEGYSVGLFLDQRDNRRRLLTGHVAAGFDLPPGGEMLNVFAFTCGFSVCAGKSGLRPTSLDLSKKYLEWGRRNFAMNGLDLVSADFIYGDAFDWMRRLAKKGRRFAVVVLDPPTFSQSKEYGVFRVEKNFTELVTAAMRVLAPGGILLGSTNAAGWEAAEFLAAVETAVKGAGRGLVKRHYVPQPPDFPISRAEPAYLKTVWAQIQ